MVLRKAWVVGCYLTSIMCLVIMTVRYGIWAALLAFAASEFMSASMLLISTREGEETDE